MFRNIIWDVDGTLFDTYPSIARAIRAALNDLGQDAPLGWIEELARVSLTHCQTTLVARYDLQMAAFDRALDVHFARMRAEDDPPFAGVIEVCRHICSLGGKNVIVTHRGRAGTLARLAAHGMDGYFAGCIARDDGYPRKPDPAAFRAALALYGLEPQETLTVGDRDIDIQAGQAAGLLSCFFGAAPDGVTPDLVVRSFGELYRYLVGGGPCDQPC